MSDDAAEKAEAEEVKAAKPTRVISEEELSALDNGSVASTPEVEANEEAESEAVAAAEKKGETAPEEHDSAAPATATESGGAPAEGEPVGKAEPGHFKLVIEQGLSINKEFLLSDEDMLLGRRDPEQDFIPDIDLFDQETPNNRYISRRQARIYFQDGQVFLEDLDSSNGTALNNHIIKPHEPKLLTPGDKILLGQSVLLRFRRLKP
jgi:hypothetical protein